MDWKQLNTPGMTAKLAATIMGVPEYVAENKLAHMRRDPSKADVIEAGACKVLASCYPSESFEKFGIKGVPFQEIGYSNDGRENAEWYAGR